MPALLPNVDPQGLLEYSVVYTDRALNHMSSKFRGVATDISRILKTVYKGDATALLPGSGTFGMEAVARQFVAAGQKSLIIRNGWFSYRWTQILQTAGLSGASLVMKARPTHAGAQAPWAPAPIEQVVATIAKERPSVVFAPHVETASGIMLPTDYMRQVADAVHAVDGLFVLDCIASGTIWVDMQAAGVDVLISAPQKGWSSSPCCAMIVFSALAQQKIERTTSNSFAMDLKKWLHIMQTFEQHAHAYHTTMPTDALSRLRDVMIETEDYGFDRVKAEQQTLGDQVRALLQSRGFESVAAKGFEAPGVVVSYTSDPDIQSTQKFISLGLQTASGVPLQCDEGADFRTFRIGLFGLDKLHNIDRTVRHLAHALEQIQA